MERLLRSLFQIGKDPDAIECIKNFRAFQASGIKVADVDKPLYDLIALNYSQQEYPLPKKLIEEYLNHSEAFDFLKGRWHEIIKAIPYKRENYESILTRRKIAEDSIEFRSHTNIANMISDIPGYKGKIGVEEATRYLFDNIAKFDSTTHKKTIQQVYTETFAQMRAPRISTGITSLNDSMRGGFPPGRLVGVGGAPTAGKTTLCAQWAFQWLQMGHPVHILSVDEAGAGFCDRFMSMLEADRSKLTNGNMQEERRIQIELDKLPVICYDGGKIEHIAAYMQRQQLDGRKPILIVDSLQTVANSLEGQNARSRVDSLLITAKKLTQAGFLVIMTSELNRGSYGRKKIEEQTTDMASGKESGGIEYKCETWMVLKCDTENQDITDVSVEKNRGFQKVKFRLHLDRNRMIFSETNCPSTDMREQEKLREDLKNLKEALKRLRVAKNIDALRAALGCRTERVTLLLGHLRNLGILGEQKGKGYWLEEPKMEEMIQ